MPTTPISHYLAYLLARANRQMHLDLERRLSDLDLQVEHWRILDVLSDTRGRSMGELAELVLMNHPTLTKMIDRMVARALVHRVPDPEDHRRVLVYITDMGLDLATRLRQTVDDHHRAVSDSIGEKTSDQLKKLLETFIRETAR